MHHESIFSFEHQIQSVNGSHFTTKQVLQYKSQARLICNSILIYLLFHSFSFTFQFYWV